MGALEWSLFRAAECDRDWDWTRLRLERTGVMGWRWAYEDEAGEFVAVEGGSVSQDFPTQSEAESWLGEIWRSLADSGVAAVTLKEESRVVYGPMSLSPASPE